MGPDQPLGKHARIGARARGEPLEVEVVGVRLSTGSRTNGLALVDLRIGPVVATYGYQRMRRKGRWQVHLPVDPDGKEALRRPKRLDEKVVQMVRDAVESDEAMVAGIQRRWAW
jgi:hypothetical protein